MKAISIVFILIVISAVAAQAVAPMVTVNSAVNLGSGYGWVSGTVSAPCTMTWTNSANGASGYAGPQQGGFGIYVTPIVSGDNRITVQCDAGGEAGYARASIYVP